MQSAFEEKVLKSLPESVFLNLMQKYKDEMAAVQNGIEEIRKRQNNGSDPEEKAQAYVLKLKKYAGCESLTREICLQLIDFITVGKKSAEGRDIKIYYKFAYVQK